MVDIDEHPGHEECVVLHPRITIKGGGGEQWDDKVQGEVNYCAGLANGSNDVIRDLAIRGLESVTGSDINAVVWVCEVGENRVVVCDNFCCRDMGITRGMRVADQSDIVILVQGGTAGCVYAILCL